MVNWFGVKNNSVCGCFAGFRKSTRMSILRSGQKIRSDFLQRVYGPKLRVLFKLALDKNGVDFAPI